MICFPTSPLSIPRQFLLFLSILLGSGGYAWSASPLPPPPLLGPPEVGAVMEALGQMNLTPADLNWDRDYINDSDFTRDPFRVEVTDHLLRDPLHVPEASQPLAVAHLQGGTDTLAHLSAASRALGLPEPDPTASPPRSDLPLPVDLEIPPSPLPPGRPGRAMARGWRKLHPSFRAELQEALRVLHGLRRESREALGSAGASQEAWSRFRELALRSIDPAAEEGEGEEQQRSRVEGLLTLGGGGDRGRMVQNASFLTTLAHRLDAAAAASPPTAWPGEVLELDTPMGRVLIGTPRDDLFSGEAILIVDPGGDDRYQLAGARDPGEVQILLDRGGDDTWRSAFPASLGGALGGLSILLDREGNDVYDGGRISLGAGLLGVGILVDGGGNDLFRGDTFTQGAGLFGLGLLVEAGGTDSYQAGAYAQGLGMTWGMGVLADQAGDDQYHAGGVYPDSPSRFPDHTLSLSQGFAIGFRPQAGGGIGLLADGSGNDGYTAELFAQGCSYWFSLGVLYDREGHDHYRAWQYGQGSGIHLSTALLADLAGNDQYIIENLGQGSSHDLAVGWLIDRGGDDLYLGSSTVQGGSLTNSASFFMDVAGNDTYASGSLKTSRGGGDLRRHMGTLGMFLDLGGTDIYTQEDDEGRRRPFLNGQTIRPWAYGIAVDSSATEEGSAGLSLAFPSPPSRLPGLPGQRPTHSPPPPSSLEVQGANAWVVGREKAATATALLASRGPAYVPELLALMPRENLLEQYTVEAILKAMRDTLDEPGKDQLWQALRAHLQGASEYEGIRWVMRWLAEMNRNPEDTVAALTSRATSQRWRIRQAAAESLGSLSNPLATPVLVSLASDPHEQVRAVAAWGLGRTGGAPSLPALGRALRDESFLVRFNAAAAVVERAASGEGDGASAHARALREDATDPHLVGLAETLLEAVARPFDPERRAFWGLDPREAPPPPKPPPIRKKIKKVRGKRR